MGMMPWEQAAEHVEKVYDTFVTFEEDERYFVCPECQEPILEADYPEVDICTIGGTFECPVCGFPI